jgi:glycine cleavage system H protein
MSELAANLLYSKEHEWVEVLEGNLVRIGISDYAQCQLGDIVFVENPEIGDEITANESMGTIESVKAISEIFSPVSGTIVTVNEELDDAPEMINTHAYSQGWLVEVEITDKEELKSLLNEEQYQAFTEEGGE